MIGALFILPFLPLEAVRLDAVPLFWVYLAYITILGSGISYAIYFRALSRMQASVFTSYLFMVPVLTTVFQSIITLTLPGAYEVMGTVLVSAGIIIVNRNFMG
jgi:drug/metabolite transporter (DMT)-like permease